MFAPDRVFFGLSGGFFFCFTDFLVFDFISIHWFGVEGGFLWLVCAGWGLPGFSGGFSFVSRVFLLCFALLPIHLRGFLGLVFVPGCVCFEPLGCCSFVSRAFFFASLLSFCFFASPLLCFYMLIIFLNPVSAVIRFSYLLP